MRDSEERWRALIQSAVDGIVVIDSRGLIESFNPSAQRLFGYSEDELIGRNVSILMPSPYREQHDGYLSRYLATNEPHIIGHGREVEGEHRDGTTFPIHLSVGEMQLAGARKFTGIIHDLRPRVRMEEQLRERATMARLGEMAAVVAHEVKNPLAGIRGAVQMLARGMQAGSQDAAIAQQIVERLDGLNGLVNDLLVFARPAKPRLAPVDLASVAQASGTLLASDPAMSGITLTYSGTAPPIMADPDQVRIVVANLLVNAAQAMQGTGAIAIGLSHTDDVVRLDVHDSGPGIPLEIRDKVFTPFFTTKARGTGLGLPTAKQLVEAQNGTIAIDYPDAGGTRVTLTFSAAARAS